MQINEKIRAKVARRLAADTDRDTLLADIDKIRTFDWTPPDNMSKYEWWRTSVSTSGAGALQAVANMFAAFMPKWDVKARAPGDQDNAELMERWLEWYFWLANSRPTKSSPLWDIVYSAAAYDTVCARVDYLPFHFGKDPKEWTKRQKIAMRGGPFVVKVFHPSSVHYEVSETMPEWVATVRNMRAADLYAEWVSHGGDGSDHKRMVRSATNRLKELFDADDTQRVMTVDYEGIEERYVYFYATAQEDVDTALGEGGDVETLVDAKTDTEFFPWVVSVGGSGYSTDPKDEINPILGGMVRSNLWQNLNLFRSMKESDIVREFGQPKRLWKTVDGQPKQLDFEIGGDVAVQPMEDMTILTPAQFNASFREMLMEREAEVGQLTNVQVLQDSRVVGGLQFSTVNAMLQVALSRLTPPKNVAQKALTQVGRLFLDWVNFTGDTTVAYRMGAAGMSPDMMAGAQISLTPGMDFDVNNIYVSCELMPNTPTDKVSKMNIYLQAAQQWPVPTSEFVEEMFGNPEHLRAKWEEEQVEKAALQIEIEQKRAESALMLQQIQGQMQMGLQQPGQAPAPKGVNQPVVNAATGPGFNPAAGGQSGMTAAPGMTAEQMSGTTQSGESMAGLE